MNKLLKFLVLLIFIFGITINIASAANVDMTGYVWGASGGTSDSHFGGVGWISFKNNSSTGYPYKVEFNRDSWELTGYAWSERYGYIKLGGFSNSEFPSVQTACQTNAKDTSKLPCNAHMVQDSNGNYQLAGFARFCFVYQNGCSGALRSSEELGGNDGWIGFKGSNFTITYNTSDNIFNGYAWAGGSGNPQSSNYAIGSGWINMNPNGSGVSCVKEFSYSDCISDNLKPIVKLTTSTPNPRYNEDVIIDWEITDTGSNCDIITATTNPDYTSNWHNYSIGTSVLTGSYNVGPISENTTFNLSCKKDNETGTDSLDINIITFTPDVEIKTSTPTSVTYGDNIDIDYSVTNIPFGCDAQLFNDGTAVTSIFNIAGNGTTTYTKNDSINISNVTTQPKAKWRLECIDSTRPSPVRTGYDTYETDVIVPDANNTFSVVSKDTNSTLTIPCQNTGVNITYKVDANNVIPGSCKASINMLTSDPYWGASTTITEDGNDHTVSTGAVTTTGDIAYRLQCNLIDNSITTYGQSLNRTCNAGSVGLSASKKCYVKGEDIDLRAVGSALQSNTCSKTWSGTWGLNPVNASNFDFHSYIPTGSMMSGQTYTYTISSCKELDYPSNPALPDVSVNVELQDNAQDCTCIGSSFRTCIPDPTKGPKFKEQ